MGTRNRRPAVSRTGARGTGGRTVTVGGVPLDKKWALLGFTPDEAKQYIEYLGEDRAYAWAKATVEYKDKIPGGVNVSIVGDWSSFFSDENASTAMAYYAEGLQNPAEAQQLYLQNVSPKQYGALADRDGFIKTNFNEWHDGMKTAFRNGTLKVSWFKNRMLEQARKEGLSDLAIKTISDQFDNDYTNLIDNYQSDLENLKMGNPDLKWPQSLSDSEIRSRIYGTEKYDGEDGLQALSASGDEKSIRDLEKCEEERQRRKDMAQNVKDHRAEAVIIHAFPGNEFEVDDNMVKWRLGPNEESMKKALNEAGVTDVTFLGRTFPLLRKGEVKFNGKNFTNRPNGMWINDVARHLTDDDLESAYNHYNKHDAKNEFQTHPIAEPLRQEMLNRKMKPGPRIERVLSKTFPGASTTPLGLSDKEWEEMKRPPKSEEKQKKSGGVSTPRPGGLGGGSISQHRPEGLPRSAKASTGKKTSAGKKGKLPSGKSASAKRPKPPKPERFYLADAQKKDRGSNVRLIEMTLETSTTVGNNVPLTMQFFNDWQTYGLDEAIVYGEGYEKNGDYHPGTMAEIKKIRDKWYGKLWDK
jgi:hypothetical protein